MLQPVLYSVAVGGVERRSPPGGCSTAPPPVVSPIMRFLLMTPTAAPAWRRWKSWTARSSWAFYRSPGGSGVHVVRLSHGVRSHEEQRVTIKSAEAERSLALRQMP